MEEKRTIANIGRQVDVPEQNMHHFISVSPWSGRRMIKEVTTNIIEHPYFAQGSMLLLDESADAKVGKVSAGVGRQYNGRLGKVEVCQVGVFLSMINNGMNCWIDGELFMPENWFAKEQAGLRKRIGVPEERVFETKVELGWKMIQRAQAQGIPFDAVACDELYGRSFTLRSQMAQADIEYYADIPVNTQVYLSQPVIGIPDAEPGPKRGRPATKTQVLSPKPYRVDQVLDQPSVFWQALTLRPTERGFLKADFGRIRVWTVQEDLTVTEEWLLIRCDHKKTTYSLSNAPVTTPLATMALRKSQRYFVERSNQDAKSEFGWDEFQATKFIAWEHQLAFTILAQWFIVETRLDWQERCERDPELLQRYELTVLPTLSVANVRTLLRAALPLPQLSIPQAADLVAKHLDNRTRSRKSHLKASTDT